MTIYFYKVKDEYGEFSNFSKHGFEVDGLYWKTSEHYFQAYKFVGDDHFETIRQAKTPMDAANFGRDRSKPLRSDWELVKEEIMYDAVWNKFTQNPELAELLLSTNDEIIIEKRQVIITGDVEKMGLEEMHWVKY